MDERRAAVRKRVIYGAVATFASHDRCYPCVVKNLSELGARIDLQDAAELSGDLALSVGQTRTSYQARVIWATAASLGLAFTSAPACTYAPSESVDQEMRNSQDKARLLLRRVNELMGED
jgi:hypothetical protein